MSRHRTPGLVATTLALVAAPLPAQGTTNPNQENDFVLNNGPDAVFVMSDPSVGFPTGTFPPDYAGDWFWKVVPKELLRHPNGVMELSGMRLLLANTNPAHLPLFFWDMLLTRGVGSTTFPGVIEPDFADPNAVFLSFGATGFADPCPTDPCCDASGCYICVCEFCPVGYEFDVQIGTGPGTGILLTADGTTDYVVTSFAPGGMVFGGASHCSDYATPYYMSLDENQADWLGTGLSAYSGFHVPGLQWADYFMETPYLRLQFVEPTVQPYIDLDADPTSPLWELGGLGGLRVPLSSGPVSLGVLHFALQAAGDGDLAANDVAYCAATLSPPLPVPMIVHGGQALLDASDPLFAPTLAAWTGPYTFSSFGGDPLDDVYYASPQLPLPAGAVGLQAHAQCFQYDLLTGTALESNVATIHFH